MEGAQLITQRPAKGQPQEGAKDGWAAIAFVANTILLLYLAVTVDLGGSGSSGSGSSQGPDVSVSVDGGLFATIFLTSIIGSVAVAYAGIQYVKENAFTVIQLIYYGHMAFFAFIGTLFLVGVVDKDNGLPPAVVCYLVALFIFVSWKCCYEKRARFAAANLKLACTGVQQHPSTISYVLLLCIPSSLYMIVWAFSVFGMQQQAGENFSTLHVAYLLTSVYWGTYVFSNIGHCTTSGAIGTWWFTNGQDAVAPSFKRATTPSFGSICFGSLIVAIIAMLKAMVESKNGRQTNPCLLCILACLKSIAEFVNHWAFVYVSIYGYGFCEAGKKVFSLFTSWNGFDAIISQDMIGMVLGITCFGCGVVNGVLTGVVVEYVAGYDQYFGIGFAFGFFCGLLMMCMFSGVLHSAVSTIYVCFVEDPEAGSRTQPQSYAEMLGAWAEFHPSLDYSYHMSFSTSGQKYNPPPAVAGLDASAPPPKAQL